MSKNKPARKSTSVDMTAMTDVAFLLLTFFMLATKFKPDEPVTVETPSSISEIKLPEKNIMLLTLDKDSRVFFSIDGEATRVEMLNKVGEKYKVTFNAEQQKAFANMASFGIPIAQLPTFLSLKPEQRGAFKQVGIPSDSLNNELSDWILQGRYAGTKDLRIAVKGDRETKVPVVKQVIKTLQDNKVNNFNFITAMEKAPK